MGGILLLVRRSMRQHLLSTLVTVLSAALASGLVMSVFALERQSYQAFTGGAGGFDAILGARGSALQLVLNSVFHLETSPGNIPYSMYKAIAADPRVSVAIPYAVGDNYHGFRIVATLDTLFKEAVLAKGRHYELEPGGRIFDPMAKEAVIGAMVAQKTGLKLGSEFHAYHGFYGSTDEHTDVFHVVGVLKPTNTPGDRAVWIPLEAHYRLNGHVLRGAGTEYTPVEGIPIPDEAKEVSAVMLKLKSPQAGFTLEQMINRQGKVATLAWPIGRSMAELFEKLGWMGRVLTLVAYLVMVVAAAGILASVYNTINERRREFAILRAIGARRRTVFTAVVAEAAVIAGLGALAGYLVYIVIMTLAAGVVRAQTGVVLDLSNIHPALWLTPVAMIVLGALAGMVPAAAAYRTDVAHHLTPQ
jgi:putative ABC transport system permease protein